MLTITLQKHKNGSILAFKNGVCCATWSSFLSKKPDYRYKYVTLNCYRYKIQWNKAITADIYEIKG